MGVSEPARSRARHTRGNHFARPLEGNINPPFPDSPASASCQICSPASGEAASTRSIISHDWKPWAGHTTLAGMCEVLPRVCREGYPGISPLVLQGYCARRGSCRFRSTKGASRQHIFTTSLVEPRPVSVFLNKFCCGLQYPSLAPWIGRPGRRPHAGAVHGAFPRAF